MTRAGVVLVALVGAARAQELAGPPDFDALDAQLRFRLEEDGRIMIWPDPAAGGDQAPFTTFVDTSPASLLSNAGVAGWLALCYQGDTDLASMADAARILRRLGRDGDAALFQAIEGEEGAPYHEELLRLLAIRVCQDRGLKPAIGVLEKALEKGIADVHVRRAAREARAALRGEAMDADAVELPPLADVLAGAPRDTDLVVCIEHRRLPSGRPLLRWGSELGIEVSKRVMAAAGGRVPVATWADAVRLSEGTAAVPYEWRAASATTGSRAR